MNRPDRRPDSRLQHLDLVGNDERHLLDRCDGLRLAFADQRARHHRRHAGIRKRRDFVVDGHDPGRRGGNSLRDGCIRPRDGGGRFLGRLQLVEAERVDAGAAGHASGKAGRRQSQARQEKQRTHIAPLRSTSDQGRPARATRK